MHMEAIQAIEKRTPWRISAGSKHSILSASNVLKDIPVLPTPSYMSCLMFMFIIRHKIVPNTRAGQARVDRDMHPSSASHLGVGANRPILSYDAATTTKLEVMLTAGKVTWFHVWIELFKSSHCDVHLVRKPYSVEEVRT